MIERLTSESISAMAMMAEYGLVPRRRRRPLNRVLMRKRRRHRPTLPGSLPSADVGLSS
jgi:hypothetical protein